VALYLKKAHRNGAKLIVRDPRKTWMAGKITGATKERIIESATMYSHAGKAMIVYGLGFTEHRTGTENAMALSKLALVCGHIGRPSIGIMALR